MKDGSRNAIIIVGPNAVGKTSVAYELARVLGNGEVINMDRLYLFRNFPISSGLSDVLKETDVPRHLYEVLNADEQIFSIDEYSSRVVILVEQILRRGNVPIIEGGSPKFFSGLYHKNLDQDNKLFHPIVALNYASTVDITRKIEKRVASAFKEGLVDEIRNNVSQYGDTKIMREAKAIVPVVKYLNDKITLEQAKEEIIQGCVDLSEYQLSMFRSYKNITWLDHDSTNVKSTVMKILKMM